MERFSDKYVGQTKRKNFNEKKTTNLSISDCENSKYHAKTCQKLASRVGKAVAPDVCHIARCAQHMMQGWGLDKNDVQAAAGISNGDKEPRRKTLFFGR